MKTGADMGQQVKNNSFKQEIDILGHIIDSLIYNMGDSIINAGDARLRREIKNGYIAAIGETRKLQRFLSMNERKER